MKSNAKLALLAGIIGAGLFLGKDAMSAVLNDDEGFYKWDSLIKFSARKYGVPWRWAKAIMGVESSYGDASSVRRGLASPTDADGSKSSDGLSWGLMQVTLTTAQEMRPGTTVKDLNTPAISIDLGCRYLGRLISTFGLSREQVIRGYNGGPGYAKSARGQTMTANYYRKFSAELEKILELQPGNPEEI